MAFRVLETGVFLAVVGLQVGMDQLDEPVQVLGSHSFVLLIKVVNVSVQDFDKEFHRHRSVHASIGHAKGSLEAFENTLSVAIQLQTG